MKNFNPENKLLTEHETVSDFNVSLLKEIIHDFSHHSFNFSDAADIYHRQDTTRHTDKKIGEESIKRSLDAFVEQGVLDYDLNTKEYSVNHTSSDVARISEEEDD
ncbi:MAG: hypothetical protein WCV73_05020 [Patescibacteria group bacterium]|jgi:hypothetical protein